ncbi:MAG: hypothetical protein ACYS1C_07785, partial [Planctomycetota bacterium]
MFRTCFAAVVVAVLALGWPAAVAAETAQSHDTCIPREALVVLEVSRPKDLLGVALDPKVTDSVTSLPAYRQFTLQPDYQEFLNVVRFLETALGTDWQSGLGKLVGEGVTLALGPDGASLLIVDAEDEGLLSRLHEILVGFARQEAIQQGQPGRVTSRQYRGVTEWSFNAQEAHAIVGNRLLMPNRPDVLRAALDARANPAKLSFTNLRGYGDVQRALGAGATARVYVNLGAIMQHTPLAEALGGGGEPLALLITAGMQEALRDSKWLGVRIDIEETALVASAMLDAKTSGTSGPAAFAMPARPSDGALPNLSVPRRIAAFSLWRDLHAFYSAKDELFPERTSSLIFFENMMGIFFTGRDLTDEVMAELAPQIRIVVAEQAYGPAVGAPTTRVPAFAAVLQLRNPARFGVIAEEAWQKAVGLINFTRGQQALPGLLIDRPSYGGVRYTVASYSSAADY